jgi:hypothetical protein
MSDADLLKAIMDAMGGKTTAGSAVAASKPDYASIALRNGIPWNTMSGAERAEIMEAIDKKQIK